MPLPRALLDHTVNALAKVLEFKYPADAVLTRYLRAHPVLGQQDRAFVAETVFAVLRRLRLLLATLFHCWLVGWLRASV